MVGSKSRRVIHQQPRNQPTIHFLTTLITFQTLYYHKIAILYSTFNSQTTHTRKKFIKNKNIFRFVRIVLIGHLVWISILCVIQFGDKTDCVAGWLGVVVLLEGIQRSQSMFLWCDNTARHCCFHCIPHIKIFPDFQRIYTSPLTKILISP